MKSSKRFSAARYSAALVAAGLIAVPATAMGAGFQNSGQSATSSAMGYTGAANPDEPNASFYNPASMGFREGFEIYLGDTIILPSTTYSPNGGGDEVATKSQVFPPPNAHVAYTDIAGSGVSAGLGMTFSYGLGIAWPEDWVGRTNIKSQDLQTININPSVAYKIPGVDLSVAAGAQVINGTVELNQSIALSDDQFVEAQLAGSGWGFGATAGVMYQPLEELTLGLNYRSRATLNIDDGRIHFEGEENTSFNSTFRDNPGSTEMTLPDLITFGVGYQLDKLFLTAQADYTTWSTYDTLKLDIDTGGDEDALSELEIKNNWENAMAFRLGAQYEITDGVKARLGAAYDMTPIPDDTVNASLPGNDRVAGTLGFGYTWEDLRVDAAYSLVTALERDIQNNRAPSGTYSTTASSFSLNLGYGY
jgi:long-chain fatty acid transport protein